MISASDVLRKRTTRHSKAQNANFLLRKYWVQPSHHCVWIFVSGYHAEIKHKNVLFYFKAISHVMGYHDDTQNFTIIKYDILAFKWRVLSIFSIPGSKVIPKNKRTLVKCPGLYELWSLMNMCQFRNLKMTWKFSQLTTKIINEQNVDSTLNLTEKISTFQKILCDWLSITCKHMCLLI